MFLIGCSLFIIGAFIALLVRPLQRALLMCVAALVFGLSFNFVFSLERIFLLPSVFPLFALIPNLQIFFRADGLALYFLLIITTVAVPTVISTHSYLQHYLHKESAVRGFLASFSLLLLSTQLLVLA
ncbi:MAG: hypothetical protein PHP42_04835, partial [Bacteroidota bacterium]|nr:hypothetical protein [Bacteroidota bacterium]